MLTVTNLTISAGRNVLVKHISFAIRAGQILALVGESGSGKSLSCLSILSLLPETLQVSGEISFTSRDGHTYDISTMDHRKRANFALTKIAYVFQEPLTALNPVQTCGKQLFENLERCGFRDKKQRVEKAKQLLNQVELTDTEKVLKAYPFQLSGGQRQRVMIAMALSGDPDLIIADEPTTALDVVIQDEILGLLKKLCKQDGRMVLLVSHDLDAVYQYADSLAVMYKGELLETGKAMDIINSPQHAYTKALLACKPRPEKKGYYLNTLKDIEEYGLTHKALPTEVREESWIAEITGLDKIYPSETRRVKALDKVSFQIRKGDSVGLIGESGSGKSTIAKIMLGLESKDAGEIRFNFNNNKPQTSNIQMIFQDPFAALNPALTVEKMLLEVILKHQVDKNRTAGLDEAVSLLNKVGLRAEDLKKYPSEFSGGQRQRLCIARALAAKPLLLICDESTSALDLSVQAQILNLLKDLQMSEQLSILMVTHSMAVASWFCNYLLVLKNGQLLEQGDTADLIHSAQEPYTQTLLSHI